MNIDGKTCRVKLFGKVRDGKVLNETNQSLFCGPYYAVRVKHWGVHVFKRKDIRVKRKQ